LDNPATGLIGPLYPGAVQGTDVHFVIQWKKYPENAVFPAIAPGDGLELDRERVAVLASGFGAAAACFRSATR
jgi:hypothetical protein